MECKDQLEKLVNAVLGYVSTDSVTEEIMEKTKSIKMVDDLSKIIKTSKEDIYKELENSLDLLNKMKKDS